MNIIFPAFAIAHLNNCTSNAICVINEMLNRLVVGGCGDETAEGIIRIGGRENCTLEAGALFANDLPEEIFVALGEARGIGGFTLHNAGPARAIVEDAVGVEFGRDGGAGD